MKRLTKRANILNKHELAEYDRHVTICEDAWRNKADRPTDVYSAAELVRPFYEARRRAADSDSPPAHLQHEPFIVSSWPKIKEESRLAAEAWQELRDAVLNPYEE